MPVSSSRGRDFGNIPEKADTTGLQNPLQSSRGRKMGKGQKSRSMKEHATGVSEGGDRLSVREHGFHAKGINNDVDGNDNLYNDTANYHDDSATCLHNGTANYTANCANHLAKEVLKDCGYEKVDPAYELKPVPDAELMRSRYCIKFELGLCPKLKPAARVAEPLWLINGGNRLRLRFDCKNCEMIVTL